MARSNPSPGFQEHPNHKIELKEGTPVRVRLGDVLIAETRRAITLDEEGYPPRQYIPRDDIRMDMLALSDRSTHCPFKGDSSYWTARAGGSVVENAGWSYDAPYDEMHRLEGYVAFDDDKVRVETEPV